MQTDNASSAENQQERSLEWLIKISNDLGYYLTGFINGEGSFVVSLHYREDYYLKWKVVLCFVVSQKEIDILLELKNIFQCGVLKSRKDGVYSYYITR